LFKQCLQIVFQIAVVGQAGFGVVVVADLYVSSGVLDIFITYQTLA
jgi:hypothetical protein